MGNGDWLKNFDPFAAAKSSSSGGVDGVRLGVEIGSKIFKTISHTQKQREMENARRKIQAHQDQLLANPPAVYGSARWATSGDLHQSGLLRSPGAFDTPSSILLGAFMEQDATAPEGWIHWDGEGHLLTVAPTRSGKSTTMIVPNLLRYRGSCVVLDPKGELYRDTSAWRAKEVGPVYRIAPFGSTSDSFNPLDYIRAPGDARALADLMMPDDPNGQDFFRKDAISFLAGLIQFLVDNAPAPYRNMAEIRRLTAQPPADFLELASQMAKSPNRTVANAGNVVIGKSKDRGLPNLIDTLNSELSLWDDPGVIATTSNSSFSFHELKDGPATVYLTMPFDKMEGFAPYLKILLTSALSAMIQNPNIPEIPVLFVLDEFLSLGTFPQFRNAIQTHAGAGVRLWFFVQNISNLEELYPTSWKAFYDSAVRVFFGASDPFTTAEISKALGTTTHAQESTSYSIGSTLSREDFFESGSSTNLNISRSVNITERALATPDEVARLIGGTLPDKTRNGILSLSQMPYPVKARLVPYFLGSIAPQRIGSL